MSHAFDSFEHTARRSALRTAFALAALVLNTIDTAHARTFAQVATAATPTVSELLNAANAEYVIANTPPFGMKPFTIAGIPVAYTNEADGVSAKVWVTAENQVVIAYQGTTGGDNLLTNPAILVPQLLSDFAAAILTNPPAYADSLGFANFVVGVANAEGYATSNVFVTGHSLGAMEAEYVASQTGLAGIGFEPTGLTPKDIKSQATNFVVTVAYGDPVGSYASDISGEQPFGPAYTEGGGKYPHYGLIIQFGLPADQATLSQDMANWGVSLNDDIATIGAWASMMLAHHYIGVMAHDLGVALNPYSVLGDGIGNMNAPVWNVANDTIPQFINAAAAAGLLVTP